MATSPIRRRLFARLTGDADKSVTRHAKNGPISAQVYVGSVHTSPNRQMGGPEQSPSITLTVYPDGRWVLTERRSRPPRPGDNPEWVWLNSRKLASGKVRDLHL